MQVQVTDRVDVGVFETSEHENGPCRKTVGLAFLVAPAPAEDDPKYDDAFETKYMTLPAAKSLLIDLRDAIEAIETGKQFE